jgi:hypothetical protein
MRGGGRDGNDEVYLTAFKSLDFITDMPGVKDQVDSRRPLRQLRRQRGAERGGGNVGRDEPDRAAKVGQIRLPCCNDDSQFGESGPQRLAH